jgi:hypothetical protein
VSEASIPRCGNCVHWGAPPDGGAATGNCHRYPPAVLFDPTAPLLYRVKTEWPETNRFALCGEWKDGEARP